MAEKALKARDLREKSAAEITEKVNAATEELFNLRFQARMGQLANPLRIRLLRKDIARAKTVLREKELAAAGAPLPAPAPKPETKAVSKPKAKPVAKAVAKAKARARSKAEPKTKSAAAKR